MFWDDFDKWGESTALYSNNSSVSYARLAILCDKFSAELPQRKSLVLIEADNSIESISALYGTLRAEHAAILYDPENKKLQNNLINTYTPDFIYSKRSEKWCLENTGIVRDYELHKDLALVNSTSGTTGSAKAIRISRNNISSNTKSIIQYLKLDKTENTVLLLPMFYSYGLSILNTHLAVGAKLHIGKMSVIHPDFIKLLKRQRITSISGVPYTFELLERVGFRNEQLPDMRYLAQAGGKLNPLIVERYAKWSTQKNKKLFVMYGQSEATARIAYMPPGMLENHPGCIGVAIPGGSLSLRDMNGNIIEEYDTPGELVYEGPNVMMGYAETGTDLSRGNDVTQLLTGDIACLNESGLYYITGRIKRFSKIFGERYNLDEIEHFIQRIDRTAVCVSDDKMLFIVSEKKGHDISSLVSREFEIPLNNIQTLYFSSKPILPSGKIDYQAILSNILSGNRSETYSNKMELKPGRDKTQLLINIYRQAFPGQSISKEDTFTRLGGDSLVYVSISIGIEKILGELPNNWERLTIQELSNKKRKVKPSVTTIETGILLRVYSILAIVAGHAGVYQLFGGAALLMMLAGINFARFHFDHLLAGKPRLLITSVLKNILIPYWLILTVSAIYQNDSQTYLYEFLLVRNLVPEQVVEPLFLTWFIHALFHSIVLISIPLSLPAIRKWASDNKLYYFAFMVYVAVLLRLIDEHFGIGFYGGADGRLTFWVFWLFCVGGMIHQVRSKKGKISSTGLIILLSSILFIFDYSRIVTISVGAIIVIWVEKIAVFRTLTFVINAIGSASIFIYLVHYSGLVSLLPESDDLVSILTRVIIGVLQGLVVWKAYKVIENRIVSMRSRKRDMLQNRLY